MNKVGGCREEFRETDTDVRVFQLSLHRILIVHCFAAFNDHDISVIAPADSGVVAFEGFRELERDRFFPVYKIIGNKLDHAVVLCSIDIDTVATAVCLAVRLAICLIEITAGSAEWRECFTREVIEDDGTGSGITFIAAPVIHQPHQPAAAYKDGHFAAFVDDDTVLADDGRSHQRCTEFGENNFFHVDSSQRNVFLLLPEMADG